MDRSSIKFRIRDIMAQKGITGKILAERMGVSIQHISNILSNRGVSINSLLKVADALGVEFGDLFESSFSPNSPHEDDFTAVVKCRKGIYTATSLPELQSIVNSLSCRSAGATALMQRTLERMLRFPDNKDAAIISELMANLSLAMYPDEWRSYYKETLTDLLPANFSLDYRYLSTFMSQDDLLALERSIS